MRIALHQHIEGHRPGDILDIPDDRATWLLANGYASMPEHPEPTTQAPSTGDVPSRAARKSEWVALAVRQGMPEQEAEAATKQELIERWTKE